MKEDSKYVIGVDGGGTKTTAALADLGGNILKKVRSGPSNLRNLGVERAVKNIGKGILEILEDFGGEIVSCFIALAAVEEEYKEKKEEIKKALLEIPKLSEISKGKLIIGSDQLAALRAGTDEKDGIVLISGTGAVCHGWWEGKEAKTSGWGWLDDEGSGFWTGQRAFQAIFKAKDGRDKQTLIQEEIFREFGIESKEELMRKVYQNKNLVGTVSLLSIAVDRAAKRGDGVAKEIMRKAGKELAKSSICVIKRLGIEEENFPFVFVGKMFNSEILLEGVKRRIRKIAQRIKFIRPKKEAVIGAVKLAIENIN